LFAQAYLQSVACQLALSALSNPEIDAVMNEAIEAVALAVDTESAEVVELMSDGRPMVRAGTRVTRSGPAASIGVAARTVKFPLQGRDGPVGVLQVRPRSGRCSDHEVQFLESVAMVLGRALQRWRDDESVRLSEIRSRALADAALDCSLVALDPDGRIVGWN